MESPSGSTYKGALSLRSLRLLRILSFFRLERSYNAMRNLRLIFSRKKEEFLVVTYMTAVVILMSAIMIFFLEHDAQPTVFSSIGVCSWWTVETITSLGYGDSRSPLLSPTAAVALRNSEHLHEKLDALAAGQVRLADPHPVFSRRR
jgi:hypothetical protein